MLVVGSRAQGFGSSVSIGLCDVSIFGRAFEGLKMSVLTRINP